MQENSLPLSDSGLTDFDNIYDEAIDNPDKIDASESSYLYIDLSRLPFAGKGLFTAINIYKDEIIAVYKGEILTPSQSELRARRNNDKYFIKLPDGNILDSMKKKCFAKYANDAGAYTDSKFRNNSRIAMDEENNVCLIASRNIKNGDEILCSYGKKYWLKHG